MASRKFARGLFTILIDSAEKTQMEYLLYYL
jgi:hypothetical protein